MIEKLKEKIRKEGRTYKWFCATYLPDKQYMSIMSQINEFAPLKQETAEAIKKYLGE